MQSQPDEIGTVTLWSNDMVLVFDRKGEQIPKYQGYVENVLDRLFDQIDRQNDLPPIEFRMGVWDKSYQVTLQDFIRVCVSRVIVSDRLSQNRKC